MVVFDRKFHQMNYRRNLLFFSNDHLLSKSIDFNNEKGYSQYGTIPQFLQFDPNVVVTLKWLHGSVEVDRRTDSGPKNPCRHPSIFLLNELDVNILPL